MPRASSLAALGRLTRGYDAGHWFYLTNELMNFDLGGPLKPHPWILAAPVSPRTALARLYFGSTKRPRRPVSHISLAPRMHKTDSHRESWPACRITEHTWIKGLGQRTRPFEPLARSVGADHLDHQTHSCFEPDQRV